MSNARRIIERKDLDRGRKRRMYASQERLQQQSWQSWHDRQFAARAEQEALRKT